VEAVGNNVEILTQMYLVSDEHKFIFKNRNRAGGMAQVLQQLPSKCETLGSNPKHCK
jgi:hypothetical protein